MPIEIIQPKLKGPDLNDPFTWASLSRLHTEWLRGVGPQLELNVPKMILGEILSSIVGDDANAFGLFFNPDWADESKALILERMDWEITTPETPKEIRTRLKRVKKSIDRLNMTKEEGYIKARTEWNTMKMWVVEKITKRPKWREAEMYSFEANEIWSPFWSEFIYGERDIYK